MNPNWFTRILAVWLLANLLFITVWDIVMLAWDSEAVTVSQYLHGWGSKHPLVYLVAGIAIGHLLLPLVVRNGQP